MFSHWRRRRRRHSQRIDPFGVGEPWRRFVREALQAQARYQQGMSGVAAGPLRERLDDIGRWVDQAAQECWRVAQRGDALEDAVSALGVVGLRARLAAAASDEVELSAPRVASLQAQLAAVERMEAMVAQAQEQLAHLEAGLGQVVASAVELSTRSAASMDATDLGHDVDHLVDEMASLRSALEETRALGA
ncbi:hypothetical protein BH24ACT2_BH24ACT2_07950 [soil metagenome]